MEYAATIWSSALLEPTGCPDYYALLCGAPVDSLAADEMIASCFSAHLQLMLEWTLICEMPLFT